MLAGILMSHPGLDFLQGSPEFQDRRATLAAAAMRCAMLYCAPLLPLPLLQLPWQPTASTSSMSGACGAATAAVVTAAVQGLAAASLAPVTGILQQLRMAPFCSLPPPPPLRQVRRDSHPPDILQPQPLRQRAAVAAGTEEVCVWFWLCRGWGQAYGGTALDLDTCFAAARLLSFLKERILVMCAMPSNPCRTMPPLYCQAM